ncbi:hypothetical protein Tsubulata_035006 [Turnera subulata]|uniref:Endonuclease/exonuclease/phosphatase domain-containing protein n=1 Tax=Turnera subulata TaxID=218843 RepID=A0A9Q0FX42_9ROSI|nr:hypothetical protein Tsubulata_035006 [Turnera subulata]
MVRANNVSLLVLVEPRISGLVAVLVIQKLGFPNSYRVEANGFSGGIWVLWKHDLVVQVLLEHIQFIQLQVRSNQVNFQFTAIYGSPKASLRQSLWDNLCNAAPSIVCPWILAGDFNAILSADEVRGSVVSTRRGYWRYQGCIDQCQLEDLRFIGAQCTWRRGFEWVRLDRALANQEWILSFPSTKVYHLPILSSGHCPLLIEVQFGHYRANNWQPRFQFQSAWLVHSDFANVVASNWQSQLSADVSLKKLSTCL